MGVAGRQEDSSFKDILVAPLRGCKEWRRAVGLSQAVINFRRIIITSFILTWRESFTVSVNFSRKGNSLGSSDGGDIRWSSSLPKNTKHTHHHEKLCRRVSSKDVPFRPRWAAHASPALGTRTDYQSVGLQSCAYVTWRCTLFSIASAIASTIFSPSFSSFFSSSSYFFISSKSSNTFVTGCSQLRAISHSINSSYEEVVKDAEEDDWRSFSLRALECLRRA